MNASNLASANATRLSRRSFVGAGIGAGVVAALAATGLVSLRGTAAWADEQGETRIVTDVRGDVEIPADPQRIVDLSGNSDILSILGIKVVGTANSDAYDYTKFPSYLEDALEGAKILGYNMQDTMDIEAVLELEPDLIIISTVQEKMYEQLQTLAPTIMIQLEDIDWKEDVRAAAQIMQAEDVAEEWLAAYEEKAAAMGEQIRADYGEDTTYLAILASGGQIFVFDAAGVGMVMYEDMGLSKPEGMPEQSNISLPVVDYEGLAQIDADYMIVVGTDEDLASLNGNAIYQSMRAVQDGNVIELPTSPYFNEGYSPVGKDLFVSEFPYLMARESVEDAKVHAKEDMAATEADSSAESDEVGDGDAE